MTKILYRLTLASVMFVTISGCSGEQWRQAGEQAGGNYQCQQENANRPDSAQRQAECDHRTDQRINDGR